MALIQKRVWPSRVTLYNGTTRAGGNGGKGTVFKVSTNGTDYTVLKAFAAVSDNGVTGQIAMAQVPTRRCCSPAARSMGPPLRAELRATEGTDYTVLKNFLGMDVWPYQGYNPGGVNLHGGTLYGTAAGEPAMSGVLFKLGLGLALTIRQRQNEVVLRWPDATASLQAAPVVGGPFTNVPSALSPYTNTTFANHHYFSSPNGLGSFWFSTCDATMQGKWSLKGSVLDIDASLIAFGAVQRHGAQAIGCAFAIGDNGDHSLDSRTLADGHPRLPE